MRSGAGGQFTTSPGQALASPPAATPCPWRTVQLLPVRPLTVFNINIVYCSRKGARNATRPLTQEPLQAALKMYGLLVDGDRLD
ncbi:unnamed protein product, partial [Iphiclides podalirius]